MAEAFTVDLKVEGLDRMVAILDRLPAELADKIMRDALQAAAEPIRSAAAANIHKSSKRGEHTADALRIAVEVDPGRSRGVAGIGAGKQTYKVRWLEFGTAKHDITGGEEDRRTARRAARALRSIGARRGASMLKTGIATGAIHTRRALGVWPKGIPGIGFRRLVHHPGQRPQAPLTRALAAMAQTALDTFGRRLWDGIQAAVKQVPGLL